MAVNAQAADLGARAPYLKAPVAMVYDWTGFYLGVNAGVGLGRNNQTLAVPDFPSFEQSYLSPQGALGGAQAGYNWQTNSALGPLVLGVEADIQGTGLRDDYTCLLGCRTAAPDITARFDQRLDWFGTVRGRVGVATGPVLSYFTAGFAYGNVKTSLTETFAGVASTFTSNQTRGGWTVGSGVEAALGGGWTAKLEYLYVDLGNRSDTFAFGGTPPQKLDTEIRENIFRVGLNYRIGGNTVYAPVATANWAGFYLGGNFGGGTARNRTSFAVLDTNERFNLSPDGINGGVQAGYNWQAANWVFGVEADIQGTNQKDNRTCVLFCQGLNNTYANYDSKLPWFGTVRGRLGYSVGSTLYYATGGYAYGGVKTNIDSAFLNGPVSTRLSATKGGWTAGARYRDPVHAARPVWPELDLEDRVSLYRPRLDLGHHRRSRRPLRYDNQRQEPRSPQRAELPLQLAGGRQVLIANTRLK